MEQRPLRSYRMLCAEADLGAAPMPQYFSHLL